MLKTSTPECSNNIFTGESGTNFMLQCKEGVALHGHSPQKIPQNKLLNNQRQQSQQERRDNLTCDGKRKTVYHSLGIGS